MSKQPIWPLWVKKTKVYSKRLECCAIPYSNWHSISPFAYSVLFPRIWPMWGLEYRMTPICCRLPPLDCTPQRFQMASYLAMIQKAPQPDTRFSVRKLHRTVRKPWHGPRQQKSKQKAVRSNWVPQSFADCLAWAIWTHPRIYLHQHICGPMQSRELKQLKWLNYVLCQLPWIRFPGQCSHLKHPSECFWRASMMLCCRAVQCSALHAWWVSSWHR